MPIGLTFNYATVPTRAHDFVRSLIGDVQADRPLIDDNEVLVQLQLVGLVVGSDPVANASACYRAAAECMRVIAAGMASESELVITEAGAQKSVAVSEYLKLAKLLEAKAEAGAAPTFANPSAYENTFVAGVDPVPDLE